MPKFTAVFRVYKNSKYDGTCDLAELTELLDEQGQQLPKGHYLYEEGPSEVFLWTDTPSVYGTPDETHEVFGQDLSYEDFQTNDYDKHENGETDYDVQFLRLEFEAIPDPVEGDPERWRVVGPPAELVLVKCEALDNEPLACGWYAYFDGTPSPADLLAAFRTKYETIEPADAAYGPGQCDDEVSRRAGLQRWFLCQAV